MNYQKIEKILERYFHGETSLAEERELKEYFLQEELPPHLEELWEQFSFFENEHGRELPESFDDELFAAIKEQDKGRKASRRTVIYYVGSVAATILLIISIFIGYDRNTSTNAEAEEAFAQASKVLYFVSGKFVKGTDPLGKVNQFSDGVNNLKSVKKFDEGVGKTTAVKKFNQITNLITNPASENGAQ